MNRACTIGLLALGMGLAAAFEAEGQEAPKTRNFLFTYGAMIKDLQPGQPVSIWVPWPQTTPEQTVKVQDQKLPGEGKLGQEKTYGNQMLYVTGKANSEGVVPLQVTFLITRKEVRTNGGKSLFLKPADEEKLTRFLQPDAKVPISGKPLELIKDKTVPENQVAAGKLFYDIVNTHMKYSKEGTGWGQGDSVWACDSKFGNCSDFHSLFISLARSQKIHSKFEMGFPIPPKRGEGPVGGYHCWAWFLGGQQGWVPVDISEANRNPEMKDYYFGNLTEDRVQFTVGRDIDLVPKQSGPPLNFFIYPYVEVNGQPLPAEKLVPRFFAYKDVAAANN